MTDKAQKIREEPIKEGLEEVAHRYYEPNDTFMDGFKKGAEWQKQQMKVTINLYAWFTPEEVEFIKRGIK